MFRKMKNRKGFTLIELIVVIAILGILAAIAIPRFSGFTERAKIGNDEQYASLIANAAMVIVSSGDVGYAINNGVGTDVTIEINPDGTIKSITGLTFKAAGNNYLTEDEFKAEIVKMVATNKLESSKYSTGMRAVANDAGLKEILVGLGS